MLLLACLSFVTKLSLLCCSSWCCLHAWPLTIAPGQGMKAFSVKDKQHNQHSVWSSFCSVLINYYSTIRTIQIRYYVVYLCKKIRTILTKIKVHYVWYLNCGCRANIKATTIHRMIQTGSGKFLCGVIELASIHWEALESWSIVLDFVLVFP